MTQLNSRQLKAEAGRLLAQARDPKKMVLIHTGVLVLLTLLGSGVNLYLDSQISGTSGLGGLGTRSVLQTVQQVLQYGTAFFTPFWQAGFLMVTIRWASAAAVKERDLLAGFKRLGSVLGHQVWTGFLYLNIMFVSVYIGTFLLSFTPWIDGLMEVAEIMMFGTQEAFDALTTGEILAAYGPLLGVSCLLGLPVCLFFHYTLRLGGWFIMRGDRLPAMAALRASAVVMRGNRRQLLRLDLSYWWYYVLELLTGLVAYLDVILVLLGIPLPVDGNVAFFATLILYGVLNLGLHLWMKAKVDTTYALAYQALAEPFLNPPVVSGQEK